MTESLMETFRFVILELAVWTFSLACIGLLALVIAAICDNNDDEIGLWIPRYDIENGRIVKFGRLMLNIASALAAMAIVLCLALLVLKEFT